MIIVDSCGWLEWFTDGKLADNYKWSTYQKTDVVRSNRPNYTPTLQKLESFRSPASGISASLQQASRVKL